jgi:hypothetical protein
MNNTFEHNRNILNSINSFNLLEKVRYNAPRNNKQITNLNPSNSPPKQIKYRFQEHNTINNYYKGIVIYFRFLKGLHSQSFLLHFTLSSNIPLHESHM